MSLGVRNVPKSRLITLYLSCLIRTVYFSLVPVIHSQQIEQKSDNVGQLSRNRHSAYIVCFML